MGDFLQLENGVEVILASQSPRRKELLHFLFSDFSVRPADIDESIPVGVDPFAAAQLIAEKKADAINSSGLVIACDTVVIIGGEILGKPKDEGDAWHMLEKLSGVTHDVVSGVALRYKGKKRSFSQRTSVTFCSMTDGDISAYLATGEPFDKAGAYGIQGYGALFVEKIDGDFFNVVGLPLARLRTEILSLIEKTEGTK